MEASVIYAIKTNYDSFSTIEKKIADYIEKNPKASVGPSIVQLSQQIGVSEASMVRFVRKIGFSGYQEFRICLARETIPIDVSSPGENLDSIEAALLSTKTAIDETFSNLNHALVKKAGNMLRKASKIYFGGFGGSNVIAQEMFRRFIQTGIPCQFAGEFHTQILLASQSGPTDLAVIFSHSGIDKDAISLAEVFKTNNCPIIVITCKKNSPITQLATLTLPLSNSKPSPIAEIFAERIASLILVDALYLEVVEKDPEKWSDHIQKAKDSIASRRM